MGADMILTACALPVDAKGELVSIDQALFVLRSRIGALSDEVLTEVSDWFLEDEIDPESQGWQERVRGRLQSCLAVLNEERRDTAELCLGGRWWMFAGGMSWGDAPSDAYELIVGLSISGVTEQPISGDELATTTRPSEEV